MKVRWGILFALLWCAALAAADPLDYVPADTVAALRLRTAAFFRHPALAAVAESGDISEVRDLLALVPWRSDGALPEVVLLLLPGADGFVMLVPSAATADELEAAFLKRFRSQSGWSVRRGQRNGMTALELIWHRPHKPNRDKHYWLVFPAPHVVWMTGPDVAMPWAALDGRYSAEFARRLRGAPADDLVFGYVADPAGLGFDLFGVMAQLREADFALGAPPTGGIRLTVRAAAHSAAAAEAALQQVRNVGRILLAVLFGADPALFQTLNAALRMETAGSELRISAELDAEILNRIRADYEANPDRMKTLVEQQIPLD